MTLDTGHVSGDSRSAREPRPRLGFPTSPDPRWTPEQRTRWQNARDFADAHPGTPGEGGWTVEPLARPAGAIIGLVVTVVGGLLSIVAVITGADAVVGVGGIVASGLLGMAVVWFLPPPDLAVAPRRGATVRERVGSGAARGR